MMIPAPFETAKNLSKTASVKHGFFGRIGHGETDNFNCSLTIGKQEQAKINRKIAKNTIGGDGAILASVKQTHSVDVFSILTLDDAKKQPEADALVTSLSGVTLSIITADCAPILFVDGNAKIIGAAHAGWQSAVNGIIKNTLDAMENLGANKQNISAAIGPSISGTAYEIGNIRANEIIAINKTAKNFIFIPKNSTREHLNLPAFVAFDLKQQGIKNIELLDECTYQNSSKYFSHRHFTKHQSVQGRQISLISLK